MTAKKNTPFAIIFAGKKPLTDAELEVFARQLDEDGDDFTAMPDYGDSWMAPAEQHEIRRQRRRR